MSHEALTLDHLRRRLGDFKCRHLDGDRRAAVAVIFRPGAQGAEVLLIHRAEDPRDPWSGHLSFPGGRVDPGDKNELAAAVRETSEEVGLNLNRRARSIGRFSDLQAVARGRRLGLVIEPFAFELLEPARLALNHEVQETLWLSLAHLVDRRNRSSLEYDIDGRTVELPCYHLEGRLLWGLTLRMLDEVIELMTGSFPEDWPAGP